MAALVEVSTSGALCPFPEIGDTIDSFSVLFEKVIWNRLPTEVELANLRLVETRLIWVSSRPKDSSFGQCVVGSHMIS